MRKTFLKVALIGTLAVAMPSTFTSCKDYDDDIENLQTQTKDLQAQLASVNTAIAALPTKADVSAAQAAAVAQAKADLEAAKASLEAAIAGKADQSAVDAINTQLSNIMGQLETIEALKGDVTAAITAINSSLEDLKEDAQTKGQMIAGLEAQIAELKEAGETNGSNVAALTEELNTLKDLVNDPTSGIAALKQQIAELAEQIQGEGGEAASLEATLRVVNGMVTSLRFVSDYADNNIQLYYPVTVEETPVGPKGEALPLFDMKKGDKKFFTDSVLVQVSPAGATLSADQLTLVNSQLGGVSEFATLTVEPYKGLLTRAISNNGLYVVRFNLNENYDFEADKKAAEEASTDKKKVYTKFEQAVKAEEGAGKNIRFAIAISENNEAGQRDVMTPYDLTIETGTPKTISTLDYNVDETNVKNIHNRFLYAEDNSSFMYNESKVSEPRKNMTATYKVAAPVASFDAAELQGYAPVGDYKWSYNSTSKVYSAIYDGNFGIGTAASGDNRTDKPFYYVDPANGEIEITLPASQDVYGYYVDIDTYRATESDESELAAWESYAKGIKGINSLVKDGAIKLTIDNETAKIPEGDVIGFRVWAVNYNGMLVDPDGRAFYVQYGDEQDTKTSAINATFTASDVANWNVVKGFNYNDNLLDWTLSNTNVEVSLSVTNIATDFSDKVKIKNQLADANSTITVSFPDYGKSLSVAMGDGTKASTSAKPLTVNARDYAKMFSNISVSINNYKFVDNVKYTAYLTIKSTGSHATTLQTIPVTVTKKVTDKLPSNFNVTSGLTKDGVINIFATTGSVADGVTASFAGVFNEGTTPITFAADGGALKYAAALLVKPAGSNGGDSWLNYEVNENKALYMNATNSTKFEGTYGESANKTAMWTLNSKPNSIFVSEGAECVLADAKTSVATLSLINGAARELIVWKQYDNYSYASKYNKDGVPTTAPATLTCVGTGKFQLKVQTYPSTYTLNLPEMPSLTFGEQVVLAKDAVTMSSDWVSRIKNLTVEQINALNKIYHVNLVTPKDANCALNLTGNAAQYFDVKEDNNIGIKLNTETGVVTTTGSTPENTTVIYGVPTKTVVKGGVTSYTWADGTTANKTIKGYVFVPNKDLVNVPAVAVNGKVTLSYTDVFGLGSSITNQGVVVPYAKDAAVTMEP